MSVSAAEPNLSGYYIRLKAGKNAHWISEFITFDYVIMCPSAGSASGYVKPCVITWVTQLSLTWWKIHSDGGRYANSRWRRWTWQRWPLIFNFLVAKRSWAFLQSNSFYAIVSWFEPHVKGLNNFWFDWLDSCVYVWLFSYSHKTCAVKHLYGTHVQI